MKGEHLRQLTPTPSKAVRKLHAGRTKAESALLTQLRTGKIAFNAFLHERRVPGYESPRCACGPSRMTVRHVLLTCRLWKEEREARIKPLRTTSLRTILGTAKGASTAPVHSTDRDSTTVQPRGYPFRPRADSESTANRESRGVEGRQEGSEEKGRGKGPGVLRDGDDPQ